MTTSVFFVAAIEHPVVCMVSAHTLISLVVIRSDWTEPIAAWRMQMEQSTACNGK